MIFKGMEQGHVEPEAFIYGRPWTPSDAERAAARKILTDLESRWVLYNAKREENPDICIYSVMELSRYLDRILTQGPMIGGGHLGDYVKSMKTACAGFLGDVEKMKGVRFDEALVRIDRAGRMDGKFGDQEKRQLLALMMGLRRVFRDLIASMFSVYGFVDEDDFLPGLRRYVIGQEDMIAKTAPPPYSTPVDAPYGSGRSIEAMRTK